jgi:hypothetical protein
VVTTIAVSLANGGVITARMFGLPVAVQVAILTLVFSVLNFFRRRFPKPWLFAPRALMPWIPVARWASAAGLVMWTLFTCWWLAVPYYPYLIFGPADAGLQLAPAWQRFYVPVLILLVLGIAQRSVNLARPEWSWLVPVTRVATNGLGLAMQYSMFKSFPYVVVAAGTKDLARYNYLAQQFNGCIQWGVFGWLWIFLLINGTVYAWLCVPHLRRLFYRIPARQALPSRQ